MTKENSRHVKWHFLDKKICTGIRELRFYVEIIPDATVSVWKRNVRSVVLQFVVDFVQGSREPSP